MLKFFSLGTLPFKENGKSGNFSHLADPPIQPVFTVFFFLHYLQYGVMLIASLSTLILVYLEV